MNRPNVILLALASILSVGLGQTPKREPMRGLNRNAPRASLPAIVIGVNASIGTVAEPGWPLIVSANPQSDQPSAGVSLPADLRVRVTDEKGTDVPIVFESIPPPTVPDAKPIRFWLASETATARLAPGRYRVTVVASGEISGWRVEAAEVQVLPPNPERRGLALLRIQRALLLGRLDEALAEAERAVGAAPMDAHLWIAKGDVLMKKDDPDGAVEAFDRALSLHRKEDGEPLALLQRRRAALTRGFEKRGGIPPQPPPP